MSDREQLIKEKFKGLDFGDVVRIEQKRYTGDNQMYLYKVVGGLESNSYVNVPIDYGPSGTGDDEVQGPDVVPVLRCICCGVDETTVLKFAVSDVNVIDSDQDNPKSQAQFENERLLSGIKSLQRYEVASCSGHSGSGDSWVDLHPDLEGDFVKWEDLASMIMFNQK